MKKKNIICFDLDNTLCITKNSDYKNSIPIKKNISYVNELFDQGYYIIIFTARFMGKFSGNCKMVKKFGYNFTKKQLETWGLNYNKLEMCKPSYDLLIDDKSVNFKKNWIKLLKQKLI